MAIVDKIDSNVTGLRIAEEVSIGVVDGSAIWDPMEPNSYNDFGGELVTKARNPINDSRQKKKAAIVDLNASGGFNTDFTQTNLQKVMQGFFFADLRRKGEQTVTTSTVEVGDDTYAIAATAGYLAGDIVFVTGMADAGNNGIKNISAVVLNTTIAVTETLIGEVTPPAAAKAVVVGMLGAAGDIDVDAAGAYPALTSTIKDFTELGLVVGEWIYIGGDTAALAFTSAENNGFKRVKSITANRLELDKSVLTMTTEANTTETVQIFLPRVLKNELGTLIKRRTYNIERTLGAPDDAIPANIQAEYLAGSVANELKINLVTADLLTADLSFISIDHETIDGATALKAGTRPALIESDAFNTSSDVKRIKMSEVISGNEAPVALFSFLTDTDITINNGATLNKAIGSLGACGVSVGTFSVSGSVTAYFSDVAAIAAVRQNKNITIDITAVKNNSGIVIDLPLIALGNGKVEVTQDEAIKIPVSMDAATAASIDPNADYTLLICFFDYLPNAADA